MNRGAAFLAAAALLAAPAGAGAQVFLASSPDPRFTIGPLFVSATVTPDLGPVAVNVSWSLAARRPRRAGDIAQDLYLLWPAEVGAGEVSGRAEPSLARYLEERGFEALADGRLMLRVRDRSLLGTGSPGQPLDVTASYVTFVRRGVAAAQVGTGTYIKIPWTPSMADPLRVTTLALRFKNLIAPRPATWFEELFWGRRWMVTTSFGDVGSLALSVYPMYFEHRDRVVRLASDFSLLTVNFSDADHLRVDDIVPASATRRGSRLRAGTETVSLVLNGAESVTPQVLRVNFSYFRGRIAWRPILISLIFLLLGNLTGAMMLSRALAGRVRRQIQVGRPNDVTSGVVLAREALVAITPGQSNYEDVLRACGRPTEEHERWPSVGRRSLVYRGIRSVTHARWALGWLATVSHRDVEHHEVTVELENDRVRAIETVVRRVRGT